MMTIAQFAERTGISASALRFYERKGLVPPADRFVNGYRAYQHRQVPDARLVHSLRQAASASPTSGAIWMRPPRSATTCWLRGGPPPTPGAWRGRSLARTCRRWGPTCRERYLPGEAATYQVIVGIRRRAAGA